jgi:putative transposase
LPASVTRPAHPPCGRSSRPPVDPSPRQAGPSWTEFLRAQAPRDLACNLFHLDTITLTRLHAFFLVEHVTLNLSMDLDDAGKRFRFLIHDPDAKFTAMFDTVFTASGSR